MLTKDAVDIDTLCDGVHNSFPDESHGQIKSDVGDLLEELARNGLVDASGTA
jgi:hypothetical protein